MLDRRQHRVDLVLHVLHVTWRGHGHDLPARRECGVGVAAGVGLGAAGRCVAACGGTDLGARAVSARRRVQLDGLGAPVRRRSARRRVQRTGRHDDPVVHLVVGPPGARGRDLVGRCRGDGRSPERASPAFGRLRGLTGGRRRLHGRSRASSSRAGARGCAALTTCRMVHHVVVVARCRSALVRGQVGRPCRRHARLGDTTTASAECARRSMLTKRSPKNVAIHEDLTRTPQ